MSGTALHGVAGFGPLAVAGVCDIAKGAVGPALAGRDRPMLAATATVASVAGHNWSPWLGGAGGRGISVAMGSLLVQGWPGTVVLASGLAAGRLCRQTGLGSFVADVALVPVLARTRGRAGLLAGAGVAGVMLAKRCGGQSPADAAEHRRVPSPASVRQRPGRREHEFMTVLPRGLRPRTPSSPGSLALARSTGHELCS